MESCPSPCGSPTLRVAAGHLLDGCKQQSPAGSHDERHNQPNQRSPAQWQGKEAQATPTTQTTIAQGGDGAILVGSNLSLGPGTAPPGRFDAPSGSRLHDHLQLWALWLGGSWQSPSTRLKSLPSCSSPWLVATRWGHQPKWTAAGIVSATSMMSMALNTLAFLAGATDTTGKTLAWVTGIMLPLLILSLSYTGSCFSVAKVKRKPARKK